MNMKRTTVFWDITPCSPGSSPTFWRNIFLSCLWPKNEVISEKNAQENETLKMLAVFLRNVCKITGLSGVTSQKILFLLDLMFSRPWIFCAKRRVVRFGETYCLSPQVRSRRLGLVPASVRRNRLAKFHFVWSELEMVLMNVFEPPRNLSDSLRIMSRESTEPVLEELTVSLEKRILSICQSVLILRNQARYFRLAE